MTHEPTGRKHRAGPLKRVRSIVSRSSNNAIFILVTDSVPTPDKRRSKQKYAKKKLLALDFRSGLLEVDSFFIPSCCVCQLVPERGATGEPNPMSPVDGNA